MTVRIDKKALYIGIVLISIFLLVEGAGFYIGIRSSNQGQKEISNKKASWLRLQNQYMEKKIQALAPEGVYIIVDSAGNRLFLKNGPKLLREAVVSCGSGAILKDPQNRRKWEFDTPRGVFSVKTKYIKPVWTKPDWAFIEEGEEIPKTVKGRIEPGVLGDYALGFGNGYYIHGTLYTRLLGKNVTHGCIRVGDEDLKAIFAAAGIGTKIFIF